MFPLAPFLARLRSSREGSAVIEFAVVCPVFLLLLLGIWDVGQMAYAKGVLNGAVELAARSSSLETANTTDADNKVKAAIKPVIPTATITTKRVSYYDFANIAKPEQWTDSNNNGVCDNGEPFVDQNRSGSWDSDVGKSGNGGAGDVVLYTVTVTYKPIFTARFVPGYGGDRVMTATAVKKNQPFAQQTAYGSSAGTCP